MARLQSQGDLSIRASAQVQPAPPPQRHGRRHPGYQAKLLSSSGLSVSSVRTLTFQTLHAHLGVSASRNYEASRRK